MKITKFIVMLAGIIGIISFFLPLVKVNVDGFTGNVSAFRFVMGITKASHVMDGPEAKAVDSDPVQSAQFRAFMEADKENNEEVKGYVLVAYAPVAAIVLFGLIGVARGKFGRVIATFTFIAGLAALGLAALIMNISTNEATTDSAAHGSAIYLMFAAGVLAALSGLIALFSPDRGKVAVACSQVVG